MSRAAPPAYDAELDCWFLLRFTNTGIGGFAFALIVAGTKTTVIPAQQR